MNLTPGVKKTGVKNNKYIPGRDLYSLQYISSITPQQVFASLFIYILIFVIAIPYFIIQKGYYTLLEAYLPNLDLVANLLSFNGGFLPGNFFIELYHPTPLTFEGFISQTAINYMALLGITYIIARETKISNSIAKGWSRGFIMLLMTYLLPSQFISSFMNYVYDTLEPFSKKYMPNHNIERRYSIYIPVLIIGALITIGIIYLEKQIIIALRKNLIGIAKNIMNIPSKIN